MTSDTHFTPSGRQFQIRLGDQQATLVEVGGGIRTYTVGGRDVLHPYDESAMCDGAHGTPLVPWPNRIGDGNYTFNGVNQQLSLTEPDKHNAIHGLLRWRNWHAAEHRDDRIVMATRLAPSPGYPFSLDVSVEYLLTESGLVVSTTATNIGDTTCPYGTGHHPYLSPGRGLIDDCDLHLNAETRIVTDPERQLPTGTEPVAGSPYDFGRARKILGLEIDFAFTGLARDAEGRAWVRLIGPDGATAALWLDESYPIVELYTADTLAPPRRRTGLGTEPMTCPPDAFRSGTGVIRLDPGQAHSARWGAQLKQPG
jgi:aldose 1-epimerase